MSDTAAVKIRGECEAAPSPIPCSLYPSHDLEVSKTQRAR